MLCVTSLPGPGKILRATMAKIAEAQPYKVPATIEDVDAITEITAIFHAYGLGRTAPAPR